MCSEFCHIGRFGWVADSFAERKCFIVPTATLFLFGLRVIAGGTENMPGFIFYIGTGNYIGFIYHHTHPILKKECGGNNIRKESVTY